MTDRFCPSCGTEVDADARFCPTCGQTLAGDDQPVETVAIPPAPAWPPPEPGAGPQPEPMPSSEPVPPAADEPSGTVPPPPAAPHGQPPGGGQDLPFTMPATLSGWLIGAGSGFAALALLPRLGNLLNLLIFVALLGISATVFLADRMPPFRHLRLATLVVLMIGLGVGLERAAFTVRGVDTIFLIAMLVAAGGALLVELDRDRPVPPPGGAG